MRLIEKATIAAVMATICFLTSADAVAQTTPHRVAVVDVAFIFKNHPGIKAQVTKVETDLKNYDAELKNKQKQLKTAVERLKQLSPGTPDYESQEEGIASMESKLRLDMARKRKELADAEAKIYFQNYKQITSGVKYLADHYKNDLVLRYNSEQMDQTVGDSVIRGVMKNIVYHKEDLDMTQCVIQNLDQVYKTTTPAQRTAVNSNAPTRQ